MEQVGVMHIVDSLSVGGAERMAVNLANLLPGDRYRVHLCTTRRDGPLASVVAPYVRRLSLERRGRFDLAAARRLAAYVGDHDVHIIHAHGTAVFLAAVATWILPHISLVWHDHHGLHSVRRRPTWLYRLPMRRVQAVVTVTRPLAEWARQSLRIPSDRVWYVPNFVSEPAEPLRAPDLPGQEGMRIVCVANFRAEKDHLTLVRAMARVVAEWPGAHLLLVGDGADGTHARIVQEEISALGLQGSISILGRRQDVPAVLAVCDVGVLSSSSEGFPLALIEYGMAGLAVVATDVGECADILDSGRAGRLVPPALPDALADALHSLLAAREERVRLGETFRRRVRERFSADAAIALICGIYEAILTPHPMLVHSGGQLTDERR